VGFCVCSAAFVGLFAVESRADLIDTVDYGDSFTVDGATRTDGLYSSSGSGQAYNVEYTRSGLTASRWIATRGSTGYFSFNTSLTAIADHGWSTTGNSGAATGVAQTGGGENGLAYGNSRNDFIVQTDFAYHDACPFFDLWAGDGSGKNTLFAWFSKGTDTLKIAYLNSTGAYSEYDTGVVSGIATADGTWHNAALRFDRDAATLGIYVDRSLKATVDLTSQSMADFSSSYVGFGAMSGSGGLNVTWVDNFAVGSVAVPEPASIWLATTGLVGLMAYAWRKRK
jgi:hypothetical protein